jgi:hypothetical protein
MQERFFILTPTPTAETEAHHRIYLDASGARMKWSAKFDIPKIGQRIYINMNGIGPAIVKGYFESEGYVGVMTKATKPPKWLRRQRREDAKDERRPQWYRDGIGCEFGTEILPAVPTEATQDEEGRWYIPRPTHCADCGRDCFNRRDGKKALCPMCDPAGGIN